MSVAERLVVVAGPSAVGKTTLVKQMRRGRLPELTARLGAQGIRDWQYTTGLPNSPVASAPRVLLDYDALTAVLRGHSYEEDDALSVVVRARRISFVTLWAPPERLVRQFLADDLRRGRPRSYKMVKRLGYFLPDGVKRRLASGLTQSILDSGLRRITLGSQYEHFNHLLSRFYGRPQDVVDLYRRWFRFCERFEERTDENLIVEHYGALTFLPRGEWEQTVAAYC